jgi:rhodanese-related sulfurtransferase
VLFANWSSKLSKGDKSMKKIDLMAIMFRFMANTMFRGRVRKSAMQYSSGPGMSMIRLMGLAWKGQKHKHIKPRQVKQRLDHGDNFVLLDIRARRSFDECHVRNAVNIPFDELQRSEDLPFSKDAEIVVACYLGMMGRAAIAILAERGYKNLANMDGGMGAWDYEKE